MAEWVDILKLFHDPALIGAAMTVLGLFYVILRLLNGAKEMSANIAENAKTTAQLVTLVEVLVYGRRREGE